MLSERGMGMEANATWSSQELLPTGGMRIDRMYSFLFGAMENFCEMAFIGIFMLCPRHNT